MSLNSRRCIEKLKIHKDKLNKSAIVILDIIVSYYNFSILPLTFGTECSSGVKQNKYLPQGSIL